VRQLRHPADGTATTLPDGRIELRFRRDLPHRLERVWRALTDPDELLAWWCEVELDLTVGGAASFHWLNNDGPVMHATITRLDPPRLIELDTDLHGVLRFELEPTAEGCKLVFTATYASFLSQDNRLLALAGWDMHLDFLEESLDGARVDWPNWPEQRWTEKHAAYVAREQP